MAYEYDHDCPFEAYITNLGKYNEGELIGEWRMPFIIRKILIHR